MMFLKLEERREQQDFTPSAPYVKNDEKQVFSAPPPPIVFPKVRPGE
jgi:hypothetical protein